MRGSGYTFLLIITQFLSISVFGSAPKYSNEFLSLGVGARAFGMSNVQTAIVNDVTAGYWNPAGLTNIKSDRQLSLMHAEYFAGIAKYDYGAIAMPLDSNRRLAFSLIRFGVDDIPNTIELIDANGNIDYGKITSFSVADYAFILSYADKVNNKVGLSYGVNAKIIHRIVGDFAKAWGFGVDVGLQLDKKKWKLGLMGRDITSTFNAWNFTLSDRVKEVWQLTDNIIPQNHLELTLPKLILGGAYKLKISPKFELLTSIDLDMTFDGQRNVLLGSKFVNIDPHWGFELGYRGIVYLRGGLGNYQRATDIESGSLVSDFQPNIGLGLRIKKLRIDYALTDIGDQSVALYSNVFSLRIDFEQKKDRR
ncbi:MAG: PorV/PorQ family protein [Bacteroidia bacterium]|nr:PorV/PorQ family protein [Bacteroidia bacterium]